jgi:methylthioxylose transferase
VRPSGSAATSRGGPAGGGSRSTGAEPHPASAAIAAKSAGASRMAAASHSLAARSRLRGVVSRIVIFGAAATAATGLLIRHLHGGLGTATPPFVMVWGPRLDPLAVVSALAVAAGIAVAPRLPRALRGPPAFATGVLALALGLGLALNLARAGTAGWYAIFDLGPGGSFEAANEYLPGLPALSYGARFYLDRFAELVPSLPVNVAGHPPGPLLVLHALGLSTAAGAAALCIAAGALGAPLTFALGRSLLDERQARVAALLFATSPLTLLFGVTSFDYAFATCGLASACLLVSDRGAARAAGACALAAASLMSWALLAVGAWAVIVTWRRRGARPALALAAGCAAAWLALNGALAAAYGYDPIGTLQATEAVYRHSVASVRPYAFWAFGSPVAWGAMLGLPIAVAAVRSAARGDDAAVALAVVIAIAAVGGFTKAETERIWLFLVPLACVAAAPAIDARRLRFVVGLLLAQALVVEVLFDTIW